jgi:hypothetical protein
MEFRHVGTHVEDIEGGQSLEPGEVVKLTKDQLRQGRTEELVADGVLIPIDSKGEEEAKLAARRVSNRREGLTEEPATEEGGTK